MKRFDTIVAGSGIAGLFAAIRASRDGSVALITKSALEESNTRYAQGGIAAALFDDDSEHLHASDTLAAGAGLCNEETVRVLCSEGPVRIRELLALGVKFDTHEGSLRRGLEAAHSRARVLHAGGDATGAHIEHSLALALKTHNIEIFEHMFLADLVVEHDVVTGVRLIDTNGRSSVLGASAVILATGGAGRLYRHTTNPPVATGDGTAAAFRAGALIADAEFYQFHPTALAVGDTFLISEAVRGEGAVLRNANGERFMSQYDERAELAPRDVVARAISEEMSRHDGAPVFLDATAFSSEFLSQRFPTISAHLGELGIDWSRSPVPVTPAAHYWMGGIRTDSWGRTSLPNLYAIGETACTGVHGANRLASNSLLEGIVFASRAIEHITQDHDGTPEFGDEIRTICSVEAPGDVATPDKDDVRNVMWDNVGLVRNQYDLAVAAKQFDAWSVAQYGNLTHELEVRNMVTIARIITAGAIARQESRGAHFRSDFPDSMPSWQHSLAFKC